MLIQSFRAFKNESHMNTKIWKALMLGIILMTSLQQSFAQIGQSRSDIIKEKGYSYKSGTADDGTKYITYEEEFSTEQSGTYTQYMGIYFSTIDDGTEICHFWKIVEPSSETNPWVSYFKKNMVEVEYMRWKDYESNILYKLEVEDGICIITAWYDFKKQ